jgi:phenylpyruvate tautomerase PptA (4-oxalocrotonate tautomerase family)
MAEDSIAAYVDIKITDGTNSPPEKAEMISQTVKMPQDVLRAKRP